MIPVRGYEGHRVAVLGLGRSGLATARALRAGGQLVVEARLVDLVSGKILKTRQDDFLTDFARKRKNCVV